VNAKPSLIPSDGDGGTLVLDGRRVALTNLGKVYFPELGVTKGDLLAYYLAIAGTILPHVSGRAIVMKRYPNGVDGAFFYMKRAPAARPAWIRTCSIEHGSGSTIAFPVIDDRASLLWVINLGCIDLDPWYSFCDDPDRPLYLHFRSGSDRRRVDYNQNAFGKTLASAYSVRPNAEALVSTPVTWKEIENGCEPSDFTLRNVPARIASLGDLWKPLLSRRGRFDLQRTWRQRRASV
jgi:DNA primase